MEQWRKINDSNYEVSSLGYVRNIMTGRILKPRTSKSGYGYNCYTVHIVEKKGEKVKSKKIHQLVARAFIENPDNLVEIDHINRDTSNNTIENLRWATRSMNSINTKVRSDNTTGFKGVYFSKEKEKWYVSLERNKEKIYGGSYKLLEEAVEARDALLISITD